MIFRPKEGDRPSTPPGPGRNAEIQEIFIVEMGQARELQLPPRLLETSEGCCQPLFNARGGEKSVVISGRFFGSRVRRTGRLFTLPHVFPAGRPKPPPIGDLP